MNNLILAHPLNSEKAKIALFWSGLYQATLNPENLLQTNLVYFSAILRAVGKETKHADYR